MWTWKIFLKKKSHSISISAFENLLRSLRTYKLSIYILNKVTQMKEDGGCSGLYSCKCLCVEGIYPEPQIWSSQVPVIAVREDCKSYLSDGQLDYALVSSLGKWK